MKFRRDDFIPENGTLTVRYLAVGLGAEHELEIRVDAESIAISMDVHPADDDIQDIQKLIERARIHHGWLKRYETPAPTPEPNCLFAYEDHTKAGD